MPCCDTVGRRGGRSDCACPLHGRGGDVSLHERHEWPHCTCVYDRHLVLLVAGGSSPKGCCSCARQQHEAMHRSQGGPHPRCKMAAHRAQESDRVHAKERARAEGSHLLAARRPTTGASASKESRGRAQMAGCSVLAKSIRRMATQVPQRASGLLLNRVAVAQQQCRKGPHSSGSDYGLLDVGRSAEGQSLESRCTRFPRFDAAIQQLDQRLNSTRGCKREPSGSARPRSSGCSSGSIDIPITQCQD